MLTDLQDRWRNERTPQAGLRLAEEWQRQGDRGRAELVLDEVEEHLAGDPRDLASRVALGSARIALDQPAAAARALEQVVEKDPTHLRANKLLVEVYLELDQRERARDRLDLYRLLNEGDPEIEALEGLLVGTVVEVQAYPGEMLPPTGGRTLSLAGGDPFASLMTVAPAAEAQVSLFEPPPPDAAPQSTATLGELYREQGHEEDAARIFRDVLDQEPENRLAQDGLAALGGEPSGEAAAGATPGFGAGAVPMSDRQRRIALLRDYLERIQRGRGAAPA